MVTGIEQNVAMTIENNTATGHVYRIPYDHIHDFKLHPHSGVDGLKRCFLMLRSQLWLQDDRACLEPMSSVAIARTARARQRSL